MPAIKQPRPHAFSALPQRYHFFEDVWETVRRVPHGKVTTYGSIAAIIRRPAGVTIRHFTSARARWVGQAMAHCPPDVPWHRVVNAQGKVSRRKSGDGHQIQRSLLEAEGVLFSVGNQIDLHRFGWIARTSRKR